MKKQLIIIITLLTSISLFAQTNNSPKGFSWQGVFRNGEIILKDKEVDITFSILEDSELCDGDGMLTSIYSEEFTGKTTNQFGLLNLIIGEGDSLTGNWADIRWGQNCYYLKIDAWIDNDNVDLGMSKITGVPFASNGYWEKNKNHLSAFDSIGVGTNMPQAPLHIIGPNTNAERGLLKLGPNGQANLRLGVHQDYSWIQSHFSKPLLINPRGNNVGIGTGAAVLPTDQYKLRVYSPAVIGDLGQNEELLYLRSERPWIFKQNGTGAGTMLELKSLSSNGIGNKNFVINTNGKVGIKTGDVAPEADLHIKGMTQTCVLKITGGCDIKEDLNSIEKIEPGDIVIIDQDNPGEIKRTNQPYDKKVAGIISGANGINPGLSLSQEDVLEGEFPLTMLGRVYVKVTGKVEIGDMITTSTKAGFGMAVNDYSKSNGTVVGKAMSANEDGEGMILILVNLQ